MQDLSNWLLQTLRHDASHPTWLEERKFEWIPLLKNALQKIINDESVILITDKDREWFMHYVVQSINQGNRPYVPLIEVGALFPHLDRALRKVKDEEEISLINDHLDKIFSQKYFFWYIGRDDAIRAKLALSRNDCFLWMFDTSLQNSFTLQSTDPLVDMKLMQMYRIFNLALEAVMFRRIRLE